METFMDALKYLATGGAVIVVSWFVSWVLEDFAWWQRLSTSLKQFSILGVAIILGLVAQYVLSLPQETLNAIAPYATVVLGTISAWLATQVAHRSDKRYKEGIL